LILILSTISYAQDDRNRQRIPENNVIVEPFDTYHDISWENEMARLDTFSILLQEVPDLIGYITVYSGKQSCAGDAQRRGMRAKKYLVEYRHIDWNRVVWKDAGYLERTYVMLWGQHRGEKPYPFYQPPSLRGVKVKDCRAKANRGKRHNKK
jgi:hypothetical protein